MTKDPSRDHWTTVPNKHWGFAQEMRRAPTHAERVVWQMLRGGQLGASFRRQHPIGPYIADFACLELSLVIELDGDVHDPLPQRIHDKDRCAYLSHRGFRVPRFRNEQVFFELDQVIDEIERVIAELREE